MKNVKIRDFVEMISIKNINNIYSDVVGINIFKKFVPTIATLVKTDLSKYKIISKNQYAFNAMHVGRDKVLPIALYNLDSPSLVSPAYHVFKISNENIIIPKYLQLIFERPKFDYEIWLKSNNGIRGNLTLDDFLNINLSIHNIEEQQHIIDIIGSIDDKIENNNKIIEKTNILLVSKFKKIYNSANISSDLKDFIELRTGKKDANAYNENGIYPFFTCSENDSKINDYSFDEEAILIAGNGNMSVKFYKGKFDAYQRTYVIHPQKYVTYIYLFYKTFINEISNGARGSVIKFLTKSMLEDCDFKLCDNNIMEKFENDNYKLLMSILDIKNENKKLEELKQLYLKKFFG